MNLVRFAVVAALVLAVRTASAEETLNPVFANWSKFKPGTSITLKSTSIIGNLSTGATVTTTLIEVGADKLVTEISGVAKFADKEAPLTPTKFDVAKTVALSKAPKPDDTKDGKPPGTYEEGTETLKIGEAKVKAKWFKFKSEADGVKTEGQVWMSDDVPGGVVKQELIRVSGVVTATDKTELVAFKKP